MTKREVVKGKGLFFNQNVILNPDNDTSTFYDGLTQEWYNYKKGFFEMAEGKSGIAKAFAVFIAPRELLQWDD